MTLERGRFDALFIADVLGTYSVYGNNHDAAAKHAVQLPAHDPTLVIPAMAAVTKHLGFAPDDFHYIRTAVFTGTPAVDARPSDRRPGGMECRDIIPGE